MSDFLRIVAALQSRSNNCDALAPTGEISKTLRRRTSPRSISTGPSAFTICASLSRLGYITGSGLLYMFILN
jgi:hypothetical protein